MHSLPKLLVAKRLELRATVRVGGGGRGRDKEWTSFPFFLLTVFKHLCFAHLA